MVAGEEKDALYNYLHQILMRPKSSEHCIHTMFKVGAWARSPLIDRIPCFEKKIAFYYGERDWMDSSSALILI
jgi:cardiolipin-specific phospholipase